MKTHKSVTNSTIVSMELPTLSRALVGSFMTITKEPAPGLSLHNVKVARRKTGKKVTSQFPQKRSPKNFKIFIFYFFYFQKNLPTVSHALTEKSLETTTDPCPIQLILTQKTVRNSTFAVTESSPNWAHVHQELSTLKRILSAKTLKASLDGESQN